MVLERTKREGVGFIFTEEGGNVTVVVSFRQFSYLRPQMTDLSL